LKLQIEQLAFRFFFPPHIRLMPARPLTCSHPFIGFPGFPSPYLTWVLTVSWLYFFLLLRSRSPPFLKTLNQGLKELPPRGTSRPLQFSFGQYGKCSAESSVRSFSPPMAGYPLKSTHSRLLLGRLRLGFHLEITKICLRRLLFSTFIFSSSSSRLSGVERYWHV